MNLNAYDKVTTNSRTWISKDYKKLYSTELEYHPYYTILKRYNKGDKVYDYYIALVDDLQSDCKLLSTSKTKTGVIKIDLSGIWSECLNLKTLKNDVDIIVRVDVKSDDGIIYYIDI